MGKPRKTYYSLIYPSKPGETGIIRNLQCEDGLKSTPLPGMNTLQDMWNRSKKLYGEEDFIGEREPLEGGGLG